ncbi:hypothetical protein Phum_PHUM483770 [Pediculus humanus corporis]|uniref:Uncharacterized protein n=1 Tax=Pediculus humanus subsp. corporis TaxID=121224 RepID=E0VWH1_PEDHC|nr:uncharacterized protein Phum_PHUM483770 [Pediculus humanus corporis]EEB17727.1 hypothetical protein Phum_PHUM483770 [Pediculus humanus corporis]
MTEVFKTGFNTVGRSKWKMMAEKNVGYNLMTKNGICLFFILTICGSSVVSGWEEGDDAVNVISVENMDALLGSSTSLNETEPESEPRSRRMANPIQKLFPIGSSKPEEDDLCSTIVHCECLKTAGKDHQIISCNFHNDEKMKGIIRNNLKKRMQEEG